MQVLGQRKIITPLILLLTNVERKVRIIGYFVETSEEILGGGFLVSGAAEGIRACPQYTPYNKILMYTFKLNLNVHLQTKYNF